MRHFKQLALVTALSLSSAAFATATSTPLTYDTATLAVTATGSTAQAVNFTVPSTSVSISDGYLRPGMTYTITVPVTNSTDRAIDITSDFDVAGTGAGLVTVTPIMGSITGLVAQSNGTLTYTVRMTDAQDAAAFAGKGVTVTFTLTGSSQSTH